MTNLIYFNREAANEELVSHHRGELIERVERITQTQGIGGELGGELGVPVFEPLFAKLHTAVSASYESGKEEEFVYSLGDDAAKFELLMEVLEDSGTPWLGRGLSVEERAGIRMDLPVIVNGPMIRTPLGELRDHLDISSSTELTREGVQDLIDSGILDEGEQKQSLDLQEDLKSIGGATGGLQKLLSSFSTDNIIEYRSKTLRSTL